MNGIPEINFLAIFAVLILIAFLAVGGTILAFIGFTYFKWRGREKESLDSVMLQIGVTRGNEIKIDAMEQLIAPLTSIKKGGGWKQKFNHQPSISFEIIAREGDIKLSLIHI